MLNTKGNNTKNGIYMWDLTVPADRNDKDTLNNFFEEYCKKWVFQLESGDQSQYLHFQCRMSLKEKKRKSNLLKILRTNKIIDAWIKPTSNTVYNDDEKFNFYCTKEDTRVEGPWSDKTKKLMESIPVRFRNTPVFLPWQQTVLDLISQPSDDRTVNIIYDPTGGEGKSFLADYLTVHNEARLISQMREPKDILRMVYCLPKTNTYFVDIPRATSKLLEATMYSTLETLKKGYCYEDRYTFKDYWFPVPPHVWVFTNNLPSRDVLSKDRLKYWKIVNNRLIPFERATPMLVIQESD